MAIVVAHRGVRCEFPENTIASIEAALTLPGLGGVEFDVELTSDARLMVLHQETVVPNEDFTRVVPAARNYTSRDWVSQYTSNDIARLDAGSWFGSKFSGERVSHLKEVLGLPWGAVPAYVELKDPTYWGERDLSRPARVIDAAIGDLLAFKGELHVISFNPHILAELHSRAPSLPLTLALWTEWQGRQEEALLIAQQSGATTISLADTMVLDAPDWVQSAHTRGLSIHVYPVSPARGEPAYECWTAASQEAKWKKLAELGVDALISDFPRETLAGLEGL